MRYSTQRQSILDIILQNGGHLSVDDIYKKVRKALPQISLGTVYRNLKQLEEAKQVGQMIGADQVAYYEPFSEPHHHFICTTCKLISDLAAPTVITCTSCITKNQKLEIDHVVTTLYGSCSSCSTGLKVL
jgi:Fur family peroxide stress response transcriptional regulator